MQKKILFENRYGINLSGILDFPRDNIINEYGIFSHCFTCNKRYKLINSISKQLINKGFGVMKFDFTGLGDSGGDFSDTNFSTNITDIIDASLYLKENFKSPKFIIGHSLGGLAAIKASKDITSIEALSTIGTPCDLKNLSKLFSKYKKELDLYGKAIIDVAGRPFEINRNFLKDIQKQDMNHYIENLKIPILVFHALKDKTVNIENGIKLFNSLSYPKNFISLGYGDHLLSNKKDSNYVGKMLGEWLERQLMNDRE